MTALGPLLPMRSAPVPHQVRNALKADVTGKGWNAKTVTLSRAVVRGPNAGADERNDNANGRVRRVGSGLL